MTLTLPTYHTTNELEMDQRPQCKNVNSEMSKGNHRRKKSSQPWIGKAKRQRTPTIKDKNDKLNLI